MTKAVLSPPLVGEHQVHDGKLLSQAHVYRMAEECYLSCTVAVRYLYRRAEPSAVVLISN